MLWPAVSDYEQKIKMRSTDKALSGKESPTTRPSPPSAMPVHTASQFRKCKSQSLIVARMIQSSQNCPAPSARERKTRHLSSLPVHTVHRTSASPRDELSNAAKYGNTTGDFFSSSSNVGKKKPRSGAKYEDCLGHDVQPISNSGVDDCHCKNSEKNLDKYPSTSSFPAMVQDAHQKEALNHSKEQQYLPAVLSGSSTDVDTTWSSWSSDYSDKKHRLYDLTNPQLVSKSNTTLPYSIFKAHNSLTVKRQLTSPSIQSKLTKEPFVCRSSPSKRNISPRKKQSSCENQTTLGTNKNTENSVSRKTKTVSPQKTLFRKQAYSEKQNISVNSKSPIRNMNSINCLRKCRESLSSSAEKNSPKKNSAKHIQSYEMPRRGSPGLIKTSTSSKSSLSVPKQPTNLSLKYCSPSRKGRYSPSVVEELKDKSQQESGKIFVQKDSSHGTRSNFKIKISPSRGNGNNMPRLKQMKTSRSDKSTDSGYQDSVSKATLDWFTAWGFVTGEKRDSYPKEALNPVVTITASPAINFPYCHESALTETALYSIKGSNIASQNHSESFSYVLEGNSGDGNLQTLAESHVNDTLFLTSLDPLTEEASNQLITANSEVSEVSQEKISDIGYTVRPSESISPVTTPSASMCSPLTVEASKYVVGDTSSSETGQEKEKPVQLGFSSDTYNVSDTRSVISDILENSDTTDVTADWDALSSISDKEDKIPTLPRFQLPVENAPLNKNERSTLEKISPPSPKRRSFLPPLVKKAKKSGSKVGDGKTRGSLQKEHNISVTQPSQLSQISQTDLTLMPVRGFNSNTRRTVEINYDLITMSDSASGRSDIKKLTFSSRTVNITQRSRSEPPPNTNKHSPRECGPHSSDTPRHFILGLLDIGTSNRMGSRKARSAPEASLLRADHHQMPNLLSAVGQAINACFHHEISEPKLMYVSLFLVIIMCFTLAYMMAYRVLSI